MDYSKKETSIAVIRLIVPIVCAVLTAVGIDADADILLVALGAVVSLATFAWSWWKNNSITKAAQEADEYMRKLKGGE